MYLCSVKTIFLLSSPVCRLARKEICKTNLIHRHAMCNTIPVLSAVEGYAIRYCFATKFSTRCLCGYCCRGHKEGIVTQGTFAQKALAYPDDAKIDTGFQYLILPANRQFSTGSDGFGAEDIELRAELP